MLRLLTSRIIRYGLFFLFMLWVFPATTWANTDIRISISDPDSKGTVNYQGTTVNTVLDTPPVTAGENRFLGTLRVTGKEGVATPVRVGDKIMVTLPEGLCYMQTPTAENYRNYVQWPEEFKGTPNLIQDNNGEPGLVFVVGTPRSLTVQVNHIENKGSMAIDFLFNQRESSAVRVSKLFTYREDFLKSSTESVTRREFFKLLADVTLPFPTSHAYDFVSDDIPLTEKFQDIDKQTQKELELIKPVFDSGLVVGYEGKMLKPNEDISWAEALALVGKILPYNDKKLATKTNVPAWAEENINKVLDKGIVKSNIFDTLNPNQKLSKAEALLIIEKTLETYSNH